MGTFDGLKTQSVPALERGLLILEQLAQSRRGVTLSQLTRKLQLSRSTVHALLLTYQRCGYGVQCTRFYSRTNAVGIYNGKEKQAAIVWVGACTHLPTWRCAETSCMNNSLLSSTD